VRQINTSAYFQNSGVPEEHLGTNYYKPIGSQCGDPTSCISTIWSSFCTDVYTPIELFFLLKPSYAIDELESYIKRGVTICPIQVEASNP
jgi:hypothetical protein